MWPSNLIIARRLNWDLRLVWSVFSYHNLFILIGVTFVSVSSSLTSHKYYQIRYQPKFQPFEILQKKIRKIQATQFGVSFSFVLCPLLGWCWMVQYKACKFWRNYWHVLLFRQVNQCFGVNFSLSQKNWLNLDWTHHSRTSSKSLCGLKTPLKVCLMLHQTLLWANLRPDASGILLWFDLLQSVPFSTKTFTFFI